MAWSRLHQTGGRAEGVWPPYVPASAHVADQPPGLPGIDEIVDDQQALPGAPVDRLAEFARARCLLSPCFRCEPVGTKAHPFSSKKMTITMPSISWRLIWIELSAP